MAAEAIDVIARDLTGLALEGNVGVGLLRKEGTSDVEWAGSLRAALEEGRTSQLFRHVASLLVLEVYGRNVPYQTDGGFVSAIMKPVKAAGNALYIVPDAEVVETSFEARVELVAFLASEALANRVLMHSRYAGEPIPVRTLATSSGRAGGAAAPTTVAEAADAAYAEGLMLLREAAGVEPTANGDAIGRAVQAKLDASPTAQAAGAMDTVLDVKKLTPDHIAALNKVTDVLIAEYTQRRKNHAERLAECVATLAESQEAKVDRVALRRRSAEYLARVPMRPAVDTATVFNMSAAEVGACFCKTGAQRVAFRHRDHRVPDVPDRGGRVNTYNFDRKVDTATRRADADMRSKHTSDRKRHDDAKRGMHVDAAAGVGLAAHGTGAAASKKEYDSIRSQGGKWGGGKGRK